MQLKVIKQLNNLKPKWLSSNSHPDTPGIILPVVLISGLTKKNGLPLVCAFAGHNNLTRFHWTNLIFSKSTAQFIGSLPLTQLPEYLMINHHDCSLLLVRQGVETGFITFPEGSFLFPSFIDTFIDISKPISELCKRSKSGYGNTRRQISLYGLEYELTESRTAQEDFYTNMYIPYISKRNEERSMIDEFSELFPSKTPFIIIHIKQDNQVIGGGVVHFTGNKCHFRFVGVREGIQKPIANGAIGAMYYFLTIEMQNRGFEKLYMGGSPPFLREGLTRYKIRMLATLDFDYQYFQSRLVDFILLKDSPGLDDFLSGNPFVFIDKDGNLSGGLWIKNGQYQTKENFDKDIRLFNRIRVKRIQFYLSGKNPMPMEWMIPYINSGSGESAAENHFFRQ